MQSLLIIGTQRSGSNMLRLMFNQCDEVVAPHPPHILQLFFPLLPLYGNLGKEENFLLLLSDICEYVLANPVPWEINSFNVNEIATECKNKSLVSIYAAIHDVYAKHQSASTWCCKSMANLYYIPQIEGDGLRPLYVHLVRDGRDVAASFKKAIVGEKHIYHLAKQWVTEQETSKKICEQLAPERYVVISYENLIHDTENTLRILFHRLGLTFTEKVMQFYEATEAKRTAEGGKMWDNVKRPVMEKNSNKFLAQLSEKEILIFESIAGDTLKQFGYTPFFAEEKRYASFSEEQLAEFDRLNKSMKENAITNFDPEGMKKRKAQEEILKRIKNRASASD